MSPRRNVSDMLLVGGSVVLDFVNTVDVRNDAFGPDYLLTYRDLLVFAQRTNLIQPADAAGLEQAANQHPRKAQRSLKEAKRLRELVYRVCRSEFSGDKIALDDLHDLDKSIHGAMAGRALTSTPTGLQYVWRSPIDLDVIIHSIALAAHDLLISRTDRRRIRECPGRNCGWVFLDTSKGGKRRWCSDKTCGTAARISKFRASAAN